MTNIIVPPYHVKVIRAESLVAYQSQIRLFRIINTYKNCPIIRFVAEKNLPVRPVNPTGKHKNKPNKRIQAHHLHIMRKTLD
jgi:hypothetical protein